MALTNSPIIRRLPFFIKQNAAILIGSNSISLAIEYNYLQMDASGNVIGRRSNSWENKWSDRSTKTDVIELPENCCFENNQVFIRIMSRKASTPGLNQWKENSSGYVDISGGSLGLELYGNYFTYTVQYRVIHQTAQTSAHGASTLKVSSVTGYYLGFKWEKMADQSVRYSAYLKESNNQEWKMVANKCTDMSGIGCGGLKSDTQYDFYYEAVDGTGKVLRHEACTARTSDKVLKVSNVTSDGFTIEWIPLDMAKHKETAYGVHLGGEGPGTAWCRTYKGINSFSYYGLKPGVRYSTHVYVYGPDGKEVFTYEAEDDITLPFYEGARTLYSKAEVVPCNGVYGEGAVGLDVNLGDKFNRKCFDISFDYNLLPTKKETDNIITLDSSHRALGLIAREERIFVTTNNGDHVFDTGIRVGRNQWKHVDLNLIGENLVINGKLIKVGDIKWSAGNNVLSSRNFSNGNAFMGQFKNFVVKTK